MATQEPLKKLVIDRTTWLRGEGGTPSRLLRTEDGKMCCMGSYCLQIAGLSPDQILERSTLASVANLLDSIPETQYLLECFRLWNQIDGNRSIYQVNDDSILAPEERERLLTVFFRDNGVEVEFTN